MTTREFAEALGLSYETIKGYIARRGRGSLASYIAKEVEGKPVGQGYYREWTEEQLAEAKAAQTLKQKKCRTCSKAFTPKKRNQAYCGSECRRGKANELQKKRIKTEPERYKRYDRSSIVLPKELGIRKSDYQTGIQTSTAPMCECKRGTQSPFTGMCSACIVESRHSKDKLSTLLRGTT